MGLYELKQKYHQKKRINKHFDTMISFMTSENTTPAHELAMIIKQVHAIEKGLAMQEFRLGFGIPRIQLMLDYIEQYIFEGGSKNIEELRMAKCVLEKYIYIHDIQGYIQNDYLNIKKKISTVFNLANSDKNNFGGVINYSVKDHKSDICAFKSIVESRHSIRDFKSEPVNEASLKKALELAMKSPSACNRQSTRVYVLNHTDFNMIENWTGGAKTFIHMVDKMLIITGQMSAYEKDEYFQYCISAGIFTGYLTLALEAYNIGACILQRPIISDSSWSQVSQKLNIPKDEQVVCAIAIGIPADEIKVPRSHRLGYERIVGYVGDYYVQSKKR